MKGHIMSTCFSTMAMSCCFAQQCPSVLKIYCCILSFTGMQIRVYSTAKVISSNAQATMGSRHRVQRCRSTCTYPNKKAVTAPHFHPTILFAYTCTASSPRLDGKRSNMLVIAPGPFLVAGDRPATTPGSGISSSVTPSARVGRPLRSVRRREGL